MASVNREDVVLPGLVGAISISGGTSPTRLINPVQEATTTVTREILAAMGQLAEAVRRSDGDSVRARWESGRYMLTLKAGKQLRRGVLNELAEKIGVVRQELGGRMKFAEMCPTDDKLSTAVERFRTWTAIKQGGLKEEGCSIHC